MPGEHIVRDGDRVLLEVGRVGHRDVRARHLIRVRIRGRVRVGVGRVVGHRDVRARHLVRVRVRVRVRVGRVVGHRDVRGSERQCGGNKGQ